MCHLKKSVPIFLRNYVQKPFLIFNIHADVFSFMYIRMRMKIQKLHKISPEMWSEVFRTLYEAALDGDEISGIEKEIQAKTKEKNLKITDIAALGNNSYE